MTNISFEVGRDDYASTRLVESADELAEGEIRARITQFAVTSNNVTYATIGEILGYWNFFPAEAGWGRVPAFGFAEVEASRSDLVAVGRRVYGYWPMASHLTLLPGRVTPHGFRDLSEHRQPMADVYNTYTYTDADPIHRPDREAQQMLLHPLFFTGFVVDDLFADNDMFGTDTVIASSASSKTAIATAHLLAQRRDLNVVGLTSAGNLDFVSSLGCYDRAISYDEIDDIGADSAIYADFSGSETIRRAVHAQFGDGLRYSCLIGGTHWDETGGPQAAEELPGPTPEFFFAPTQIAKRTADWGRPELDRRLETAWSQFSEWTDSWLEIRRHEGPDAMAALWTLMLNGEADPSEGHTATLS